MFGFYNQNKDLTFIKRGIEINNYLKEEVLDVLDKLDYPYNSFDYDDNQYGDTKFDFDFINILSKKGIVKKRKLPNKNIYKITLI